PAISVPALPKIFLGSGFSKGSYDCIDGNTRGGMAEKYFVRDFPYAQGKRRAIAQSVSRQYPNPDSGIDSTRACSRLGNYAPLGARAQEPDYPGREREYPETQPIHGRHHGTRHPIRPDFSFGA